MATSSFGPDMSERSGVDLSHVVTKRRARLRPASATPWVLLVFALGAGGFVAWELKTRVATARATAERSAAELEVTRQRAFDAEKNLAALTTGADQAKADAEKLRADNAVLLAENQKLLPKAEKADALALELEKSVKADEGSVTNEAGRLSLDLLDKVLFQTGKAELTATGKKVLARVGATLNKFPDRQIWVIGHTDAVPIKTDQFPSNWELSTARAVNVVHFLIDDVKVDKRRLAAAGFADNRPASRSTRAKNRRIELVLFPKDVKIARP
jgi:chemotaxis protein MotB